MHVSISEVHLDIILDDERVITPCRGGGKSGVTEFQRRRSIDPGHEGGDASLIIRGQTISGGAIDGFLGQCCLLRVQLLVQIYDELVQAVPAGRAGSRHCRNRGGVEHVVARIRHCFEQLVEASGEAAAVGLDRRCRHLPHICGNAFEQPRGSRDLVAIAFPARRFGKDVETLVADPAGGALALKVGDGLGRVVGVRGRPPD